jgi:predicted anti-sigma-YlaC factor YlaD
MSHITEKLAEFVFEELSLSEMTEAKMHLNECVGCREDLTRFQRTLGVLKTSSDLEPPRNVVFEFEKPASNRFWRWFPATAAIAALLLITVALIGRVHFQWRDSQLTIAFGQPIAPAQADQTAELAAELQRVKGYLAYLDNRQQAVERDTVVIAARMQPGVQAPRSPGD